MQWEEKKTKKLTAKQKASLEEYPEVIANLLANRGILTKAQQKKFFKPEEKDFGDPFKIPDMKKAVNRTLQAREKGEKVAVYGDYDVDGVCASYILWDFLYRQLGMDAVPFIPSRFTEGYGLNKEAIKELGKNGVNLVITVDCGIKDAELISSLKNIDFIVTDHHTPPEQEKFASLAVHPGRKNSKYPFREISGTTVAWKLIHALVKKLKEADGTGRYDHLKYLEFAALATVCDVMPLVDENRAIVKLGLKAMQKTENPGLRALIRETGIEGEELGAYHCGFVIGPRINAAGRLVDAIEVVRLFATESPDKAAKIAHDLSQLNTQRQDLTFKTLQEALLQVEEQGQTVNQKLIFAAGENWHEGVIGLVAGKLTETYHRPSICATIVNGKVTASARSIASFNITQAISEHSDFLSRFGGHAQAAGFSLDQENLSAFQKALQKLASRQISEQDLEIVIKYDQKLDQESISLDLVDWTLEFEPFGLGNPRPVFYFEKLTVVNSREIGKEKKHVKLILLSEAGQKFEAIHFNASQRYSEISLGDKIDIIASIEKNVWNGRVSLQLKIKDMRETLQDGI